MPQRHTRQAGVFHITVVTKDRIPWCTREWVPRMIIDNLVMTRNIHGAKLYAFAILPDHVHVILEPKPGGLSRFIQSFKSHSSREINLMTTTVVAANHGSLLAATHESPLRMHNDECTFKEPRRNMFSWQKGYYDEHIRDGRQFSKAMYYVQGNAMHHHLVNDLSAWPWSSLHSSDLLDLSETWLG